LCFFGGVAFFDEFEKRHGAPGEEPEESKDWLEIFHGLSRFLLGFSGRKWDGLKKAEFQG